MKERGTGGPTGIPAILTMREGLFREGLKALLSETDYRVVDRDPEAGADPMPEGVEAEDRVVILIESDPEDRQSLAEIRKARASYANGKTIVIAGRPGKAHLRECLQAGANGYLLPGTSPGGLLDTIALVLNGQIVFPAEYTASFAEDDAVDDGGAGDDPQRISAKNISGNDRRILRMLVAGMSNKEMGKHLQMPDPTVKVLLYRVLKMVGAVNRVQGAVWAVNNGLAPFDPSEERPTAPVRAVAG